MTEHVSPSTLSKILALRETYLEAKWNSEEWAKIMEQARQEIIIETEAQGLDEVRDQDDNKIVSISWSEPERVDVKALREQFPDIARQFSKTTGKVRRVTIAPGVRRGEHLRSV